MHLLIFEEAHGCPAVSGNKKKAIPLINVFIFSFLANKRAEFKLDWMMLRVSPCNLLLAGWTQPHSKLFSIAGDGARHQL